jgi:hypothetical protein
MKEQTRSEIQFTMKELEKTPLLCKIRAMIEEIISLAEHRTPPTERDTEDHQQNRRNDGEASMQIDNEQSEKRTK